MTNKCFTLSNRWIIRHDPFLHKKYFAYNIDNAEKYYLNITSYVILSIFEYNYLSCDNIFCFIRDKNICITFQEVEKIVEKLFSIGFLSDIRPEYSAEFNRINPFEKVNAKISLASSPYEVEIHFTKECNLLCKHCFYSAGNKFNNQLNKNDWIRFFEDLEENKILRLIISGGEPLLFPEVKSLLNDLAQRKIRIDLLTNGTLIDNDIAKIISARNFSTSISIDGVDDETHNFLRGKKCFSDVTRSIEMLAERRVFFQISTTLHKKNYIQIDKLIEWSIQKKANSINFILIDPMGRAAKHKNLLLDKIDVESIVDMINSAKKKYKHCIEIGFLDPSKPQYQFFDIDDKGDELIYCTAGTARIAVRSDGNVFPCTYGFEDDFFCIGNIRNDNIFSLWRKENLNLFRGDITLSQLPICANCEIADNCTLKVCRLRAYYKHGDFFGVPPGCYQADFLNK
jgi:radical SAM protein with 4Fe4S-binding SPASM domain